MDTIDVGGGRVEYRLTPSTDADCRVPPLVFLHEGLGSCSTWRTWPEAVRTSCRGPTTLVYSRHGHGGSAVVRRSRRVRYMHDEALDVLPVLLDRAGVHDPILVGHSDGASIATIAAGAGIPVAGLVLIAPHVFVEDLTIASIQKMRTTYEVSDLRDRLARHHDDPDATFRGWNDVWLSTEFRRWDIQDSLSSIECPTLLVQGTADEYGTLAELDAIEAGVRGQVQRCIVANAGHAPHLDEPTTTVDAVARFVGEITRTTERTR